MDTASLMGFAMLGSMKKPERKRAESSLVLTLVPGPPATRAAIATMAVSNQARDGFRREMRVASAVVGATEAIAAGESAVAAFAGQSALRDLAPDQLAARFAAAFPVVDPEVAPTAPPQVGGAGPDELTVARLREALHLATEMVVTAIGRTKGSRFSTDEALVYDDYLDLLSGKVRDQIVKSAELK